MAQYWEDFSGYTVGDDPTVDGPAGWTKRWDAGNVSLEIVSDASAPAGKAMRITKSASDRTLVSYDAVDADANRATAEVVALIRVPTGLVDGNNFFGTVARGSGTDTTETGRVSSIVRGGSAFDIRAAKYVAATFTFQSNVLTDYAAGDLVWVKLDVDGNVTTATTADNAAPGTATYTSTETTTDVTGAGWCGVFSFTTGMVVDVLAFSIGTNGDAALYEAPAATEVEGVNITLYDGSTAQASLTGLTVLWWDSAAPSGAPDYETTGESTDASGVLSVDLSASTALSVGQDGFMLVYKADGADYRDSLVFASKLAVQDIS